MPTMDDQAASSLAAAKNERVEIAAHDPRWAEQFAAERQRLLDLFPGKLLGLEHIGSTAVAGLAAKPIVDMLGDVESMCLADEILRRLCQEGYATSAEFNTTLGERRWLMRHQNGRRTHHLHLVIHDGIEWRMRIKFRDALRADRELAVRYEALKRDLAARFAQDRDKYTDGKGEFIDAVVGMFQL